MGWIITGGTTPERFTGCGGGISGFDKDRLSGRVDAVSAAASLS